MTADAIAHEQVEPQLEAIGFWRRAFSLPVMIVVLLGLVSGGIVSAWAVGFVEAYLYELTVADPRIWTGATLVVMLTAFTGALIPAWRASRTDPLKALRVE